MNSCPRTKISRATVKYKRQSLYFSRSMHLDHFCIFCGFSRVSLYRIVDQLFNFWVTDFCKRFFFCFCDQLKVNSMNIKILLLSWFFFKCYLKVIYQSKNIGKSLKPLNSYLVANWSTRHYCPFHACVGHLGTSLDPWAIAYWYGKYSRMLLCKSELLIYPWTIIIEK